MFFRNNSSPVVKWRGMPVDRLTLTRLEARIRLADHVYAALAAHDLTVGVTVFERLE